MQVKELQLINFKNYSEVHFSFSDHFNCLTGDNGQGKSNVLDALYYMAYCKSFLNTVDSQNIKRGEAFFMVQAEVDGHDADERATISCGFTKGKKKLFKKGQNEYEKLADHIGFLPLVMISPYDSDLIREGSELRRKFFDSIISQYDRSFLNNLQAYGKALKQRNTALKNWVTRKTFDAELDAIYRQQLAALSIPIHKTRKAFLVEFIHIFEGIYKNLSNNQELPNLTYVSQLERTEAHDLFEQGIVKDKRIGHSTVGIHKDDYIFELGNFPIKKFGSQGQQKTYLIALKLAQYQCLKEKMGKKPLMLLDDIFDKLDEKRVHQLLSLLKEDNFGQVFLTDTDKERTKAAVEKLQVDVKLFHIAKGEVDV